MSSVDKGEVLVFRYDQTSAQAKVLENQALRLSSEAREESSEASSMLRNISRLEQELLPGLEVGAHSRPQEARWPHLSSSACSGWPGRHDLHAEATDRSGHQEQRGL